MKKILFTCFLALLCLFGSPFSAWSKVAESPPAGEFQSPAILRGGNARPDTFQDSFKSLSLASNPLPESESFRLKANAEPTSDIGHPTPDIKNKFGLVDPDQDMGAGEGTSGLQPAPVTVFLVHRDPEPAGPLIAELWDAEMYGLPGFANHQRMEIPPMEAHLLTGLMPREERGYRLQSPSISGPSILRLSFGHVSLIRDFWVSPGDSVMIGITEKSASMIFTGPSAASFRLQKELDEVVASFAQGIDVGLSFSSESDREAYLDQEGNRAAWDSISGSFGRKTILKVAGRPEMDYLRQISVVPYIQEIKQRLELYAGQVPEEVLEAGYARAIGGIYRLYVNLLSSAFRSAAKLGEADLNREMAEFIQSRLDVLPEESPQIGYKYSPDYRSYLTHRAELVAMITQEYFFETVFQLYPQEVAERLAVQHLGQIQKRIKDFENQAESLQLRLQNPTMKTSLEELTGRFGQGAPLFSFDLPDLKGRRIKAEQFKGKALLIDFWISGCGACKSFHTKIFDPLIQKYGSLPGLEIISVSADRSPERWVQQGGTPDVTGEDYIPVYAEREADANPFLSRYQIHSYPQLMLVRPDGTLFRLGRVPASLEEAEELLMEAMKPSSSEQPKTQTFRK